MTPTTIKVTRDRNATTRRCLRWASSGRVGSSNVPTMPAFVTPASLAAESRKGNDRLPVPDLGESCRFVEARCGYVHPMDGDGHFQLTRRSFLVGTMAAGVAGAAAACGLFGDDGPQTVTYGDHPSQF